MKFKYDYIFKLSITCDFLHAGLLQPYAKAAAVRIKRREIEDSHSETTLLFHLD